MDSSKDRLVAEVAAASGRYEAAVAAVERARIARNGAMLRAHKGKVPYGELQVATGLTRTGVYKALEDAAGGSLRGDSTPAGRVD